MIREETLLVIVKNDVEGMLKEVLVAQFEQLIHTCIKIALKL